MNILNWLRGLGRRWRHAVDRFGPSRRLIVVDGDSLPDKLPWRDVVLARDGNEDWCVGLACPCGCGQKIELLVVPEAKPRWDVTTDAKGRPSLRPSVWLQRGCRSHFWLRHGKIEWCN
jgi:hypothetical protein